MDTHVAKRKSFFILGSSSLSNHGGYLNFESPNQPTTLLPTSPYLCILTILLGEFEPFYEKYFQKKIFYEIFCISLNKNCPNCLQYEWVLKILYFEYHQIFLNIVIDYSDLSNITKFWGEKNNSCTYILASIYYLPKSGIFSYLPTYLSTRLIQPEIIVFLGLMLDGWLGPNCVGFSLLGIELNR